MIILGLRSPRGEVERRVVHDIFELFATETKLIDCRLRKNLASQENDEPIARIMIIAIWVHDYSNLVSALLLRQS